MENKNLPNFNLIEKDPIFHSHFSDDLDVHHPLAYDSVDCDRCGHALHAFHNECMDCWFEFTEEKCNLCKDCFFDLYNEY